MATVLKIEIQDQGFTYKRLGAVTGINPRTLGRTLNHRRKLYITDWVAICVALDLDLIDAWKRAEALAALTP